MPATRIGILGIGAVGGYFGGLLAEKYAGTATEIIFIAREKSVHVIREKGLKIITPETIKVVHPHLVSCDPAQIGPLDYLICCVKSYDLEESLNLLNPCIRANTIILPLLNGVDSKPLIQKIYPGIEVWEGCVYIVSRLTEPGVVTKQGKIHTLHFGSPSTNGKLRSFETILLNAGIDANVSGNILQTVWEKFVFISVLASVTSHLDLCVGPIRENEEHLKLMDRLFREIVAVAKAKGIDLPHDIVERSMATVKRLPDETTSSMHSDFKKGGKTEYRSLTEYVVNEGKRLNVKTPEYEKVLNSLRTKACS